MDPGFQAICALFSSGLINTNKANMTTNMAAKMQIFCLQNPSLTQLAISRDAAARVQLLGNTLYVLYEQGNLKVIEACA